LLEGGAGLLHKAGSEHFVAGDDTVEAPLQRSHLQPPSETERPAQVIGGAARVKLFDEP